jgi:hypothetical protein
LETRSINEPRVILQLISGSVHLDLSRPRVILPSLERSLHPSTDPSRDRSFRAATDRSAPQNSRSRNVLSAPQYSAPRNSPLAFAKCSFRVGEFRDSEQFSVSQKFASANSASQKFFPRRRYRVAEQSFRDRERAPRFPRISHSQNAIVRRRAAFWPPRYRNLAPSHTQNAGLVYRFVYCPYAQGRIH